MAVRVERYERVLGRLRCRVTVVRYGLERGMAGRDGGEAWRRDMVGRYHGRHGKGVLVGMVTDS